MKVSRLGMMRYEVSLTVNEFRDKKKEEKICSYEMRQRSMILNPAQGEIINSAYQEIVNAA